MDDEKYFSLSNTNLPGHVYYYTSDKSAAPPDIKYKKRSKYEPTIMIQLVVSSKGVCEPYIHRSNRSINADVYLNQCVKSKLIPFIKKHHANDDDMIFWPDLVRAHHSKEVLTYFDEASVPIVPKTISPPNIPQGILLKTFGMF